jgi:L-asparaginase II
MQSLVNVYRGNELESFHSGSIAVVDSTGRILAYSGDPTLSTYLRSAAKPFQAVPLLQSGGRAQFDLTDQELALICGSHGGEAKHVSTAAAILRKGEFDESDLQCGAHMPYDERAASELRQANEAPNVLHNNCSGKHGGMLLGCELIDAPPEHYLEDAHPLQQRIRETICDFSGLGSDELPVAIDGCGVPSYFMSLYRAAFAYARFAATAFEMVGALPSYADSAGAIVQAMTGEPSFVAGNWSMTTPLMEAFDGQLLAKEGAEGFYGLALLPGLVGELTEKIDRTDGALVGVAIKVHDGSMKRGRDPVVIRTLELLGLDVAAKPELARHRQRVVKNVVGKVVGEVRAEFELSYV